MPSMVQSKQDTRASDTASQVISLVDKARDGSRTAFGQLVNLFQDDIFRLVYYRTRSSMDAEDLTQEIFIQAFRNLHQLKEVDRFRNWLFRIALNRVRDFYRKKRFLSFFGAFTDSVEINQSNEKLHDKPEPLDNLMKHDFWKQVEMLLNKLSHMEREVFLLRFFDSLSIKEISLVLKKNESTVKTHLYRGLLKFKKESSPLQLLREETS